MVGVLYVGVGQHGSLGVTRCTARVNDAGRVAVFHGDAGEGARGLPCEQGFIILHIRGGLPDYNVVLDRRQIGPDALDQFHIAVTKNQNLGRGIIQNVGDFFSTQPEIQIDGNAAHLADGVRHLAELKTVGLENSHPVPGVNPHVGQGHCQAVCPVLHLPEAQAQIVVNNAGFIGIRFTCVFDDRGKVHSYSFRNIFPFHGLKGGRPFNYFLPFMTGGVHDAGEIATTWPQLAEFSNHLLGKTSSEKKMLPSTR